MISNAELDRVILSHTNRQWQKTAMIIAKALDDLETSKTTASDAAITQRISALTAAGRLEVRGDLADWRHSEIRLLF